MEKAAPQLSCDQNSALLKIFLKNYTQSQGDEPSLKNNRKKFGQALSRAQKSACASEGLDLRSDDPGSAAFQ